MLRFEWSAYVTPALLGRLAEETGVARPALRPMEPVLAAILSHVGGLPFVEVKPSLEQRTERGLLLLAEAAGHTLAEAGVRHTAVGTLRANGEGLFEKQVRAVAAIDANQAGVDELTTLPEFTPRIAAAVLAERARSGRFTNLKDLDQRVDGIGAVRTALIADAVTFNDEHPWSSLCIDRGGDLGANLRTLMTMQAVDDRGTALLLALDRILTSVATHPHPGHDVIRQQPAAAPAATSAADWIGELWGADYWPALPALIDGANAAVTVCMFHIAAPDPEHPTYTLLQALTRAHDRAVTVRVLVDRDNRADPYHSTVINSAAKGLLLGAGVATRSDRGNRLLHSKYLVIDHELVIIGSHNWSKGSYFDFDDLSVVIRSGELATELETRFDVLWATGS